MILEDATRVQLEQEILKLWEYSGELENKLAETEATLREAIEVIKMVQNNSLMPHHHTDPQLRLYCLSERASELLAKIEITKD